MRRFYVVYQNNQIGETVFSQFDHLPTVNTGRKFYLSWSHYLKFMRIDNIDERHFYEIEAIKNDWSLSELKRQYNTSLYERIALSTNLQLAQCCAEIKNNAVVEMTLPEENKQIFAGKYETVLPSKEALQKLLKEQMEDDED